MNLTDLALRSDPIAVSTLPLEQRDFLEAEKAIWGKTAAVLYTAAAVFCGILLSIYGICTQLGADTPPASLLFFPAIGLPLFSGCYCILPNWMGALRYRQYVREGQGQTVAFYPEHFEILANGVLAERFLYEDIGRIVVSENLYILLFPDFTCIPIPQAGISEEHWARIRQCIRGALRRSAL